MQLLQQAEGTTVNDGFFVDITGSGNVVSVRPDAGNGEGIRLLRESYVQHEAIHDSDARGDLGCHPGTRQTYISRVTSWGSGEWEPEKRAFLMTGPAGAGKSAIARTCAHNLDEVGNLGASFFFFRPDNWNDPKKFIPTIVYQLAMGHPVYRHHIDTLISGDPFLLEKATDIQFRELLVKPLQQLSIDSGNLRVGKVVIIDGLDECAAVDEQVQIIDLIATSIREQTTPFLWAFFTRPEPHITSTFLSKIITDVSWELPLPVSGDADADSDIDTYLRSAFGKICAKYGIPSDVVWPVKEDIDHLVSQSAGLFAYAVTVTRYIEGLDKGRSGLHERLQAILQRDRMSPENPFSALDELYTLAMMQIPEAVLPDTMSLLYLSQTVKVEQVEFIWRYMRHENIPIVHCYCIALGLRPEAFHVAISNLSSVLRVTRSQRGDLEGFQFYHESFVDFLLDQRRSKRFFVKSPAIHRHCLEMIDRARSTAAAKNNSESPKGYAEICMQQVLSALDKRSSGNTWLPILRSAVAIGDSEYGDSIESFIQGVMITLVEHDEKLGGNILQRISQIYWKRWFYQTCNRYLVVFQNFLTKTFKGRCRIAWPSLERLPSILRRLRHQEPAVYIIIDGGAETSLTIAQIRYLLNKLEYRRGQAFYDDLFQLISKAAFFSSFTIILGHVFHLTCTPVICFVWSVYVVCSDVRTFVHFIKTRRNQLLKFYFAFGSTIAVIVFLKSISGHIHSILHFLVSHCVFSLCFQYSIALSVKRLLQS